MSELKSGIYHPVYYLMGEEGYYTDKITDYIIEHSLTEVERDFNLTVYYGLESDIDTIVTAATANIDFKKIFFIISLLYFYFHTYFFSSFFCSLSEFSFSPYRFSYIFWKRSI